MNALRWLAFLAPSVLCAAISQTGPIPDLFDSSDFVCRGAVISDEPLAPNALDAWGKLLPTDYAALIHVSSCYKGLVPGGGALVLSFSSVDPMTGAPLSVGSDLLLFMKVQADGALTLTNPTNTTAHVWLTDFPPGKSDSTQPGIVRLEDDLVEVAINGAPAVSLRATDLLLRFPDLSAKSLQRLKSTPLASDSDLALLRLVLLARSDTSSYLPELMQALKYRGPDASLPAITDIAEVLSDLTGRGDLKVLEDMSRSGLPYLRQTAMLGLRRIKDPSTVPFLVEQLDSDDLDVRYQAVITLAEMTGRGGDFGPSLPLFEQNPEKHTDLWKRWWSTEGSTGFK